MSNWTTQYDFGLTHIDLSNRSPQQKRSRTVEKCTFCRERKQLCSYTSGPRLSKCKQCQEKGLLCSKPQLALRKRGVHTSRASFQENYQSSLLHSILPQLSNSKSHNNNEIWRPKFIYPSHHLQLSDGTATEAVLLLSLQEILAMAIEELIEMVIVMVRPPQRDPIRADQDDAIPELHHTVSVLKNLSRAARDRMLSTDATTRLCQAQEALSQSRRPLLHYDFLWGNNELSVSETRASIQNFRNNDGSGLAYVLQIRLLQAGVAMTQREEEDLLVCRKRFTEDLKLLFLRADLPITLQLRQCPVFMPKDLVRITTFAEEILRDDCPDYLGRRSFQVLSDAGMSIKWLSSCLSRPSRDLHFKCDELSLVSRTYSPNEANVADNLGRTAIHIAVRQGLIGSVMTLAAAQINMHQTCLNGLTLMHIAACQGNTDMIRHLIANETYSLKLDTMDQAYRTAFWYAARGSHIDAMNTLTARAIRDQVNVEHEDLHGHSALAIAARDGRSDVLDRLFRLRNKSVLDADVLAPPPFEYLVFVYGVQSKNARCIDLVKEHRTWRYGDDVWQKAIDYADLHKDKTLRAELQSLYRSDMLPAAHDLPPTFQDPCTQHYPLTDLSVLMTSAAWTQTASLFPT